MTQHNDEDLRLTAELIINQTRAMQTRGVANYPPGFDISRTHSINLITEEFLGGYMHDGRMSVIRRFFCLFVTFDLVFVSLLWLICILINGDSIIHALQKQILHYTVNESLFDVVAAALCRFLVLIFFYALFYVNHWLAVALSTTLSCLFLMSKVFLFNWVGPNQQIFVVILILSSFVLAWGEAWFLDCRVLPQERHARHYFSAITEPTDRSPLMAPLFTIENERRPPESVVDFYSPLDSDHSDEEAEQDEEYHQMGLNCLRKAHELLQVSDWKVEKVTKKGDTISSIQRDKLGKIYKLTGRLKYPAKILCNELFYKIEEAPHWNPTILESKIVRKVNTYTDISYQATVGGGGGFIKPRDFVNLRCWRLFVDGKMCDNSTETDTSDDDDEMLTNSCEGSVSTISDHEECAQSSSVGSFRNNTNMSLSKNRGPIQTLSKSLGAKEFCEPICLNFNEPPPLNEVFEDAKDHLDDDDDDEALKNKTATHSPLKGFRTKGKVWLNAAISVDYDRVPATTKYTRGENLVAAFAMHEIVGKTDACIFEWILCLDLKGFIPRYILDTAYTTFMTDYMTHLRKYISELRQRRRRVPRH